MRLRSDLFVSAYLRRCTVEGATAVLRRRGAAEAGAILVKVDRLDGRCTLYGPAPQTAVTGEPGQDRLFVRMHDADEVDPLRAEEIIAREVRFDPDIWVVEAEDRAGQPRLDLVDR